MFVGTFEHSLDDKGRVVLPSTFRGYLAEKGFLSLYEDCLGIWTEPEFRAFVDRLTLKSRDGSASPAAVRGLAARTHEIRPDSQGRITIPQQLREQAHLGRDVAIVGAIERIEIWDLARWREIEPATAESLTIALRDGV